MGLEEIARAIEEGPLPPALDAPRAVRGGGAAAPDLEPLAGVLGLAERLLPLLAGRFQRSCWLVIAAAEQNLRVLTGPEPVPEPAPEPEPEPEPEPAIVE